MKNKKRLQIDQRTINVSTSGLSVRTEKRAENENEEMIIEGYGAVFGEITNIGGWYYERIMPGAFKKTISENKEIVSLFNHDPNEILGRVSADTLEVWEDSKGLRFKCVLPDTEGGKKVHNAIMRGDVTGCSFMFSVVQEEKVREMFNDSEQEIEVDVWNVQEVKLFEVGPVVFPQYQTTEIDARGELSELKKRAASGGLTKEDRENLICRKNEIVEILNSCERADESEHSSEPILNHSVEPFNALILRAENQEFEFQLLINDLEA